MSHGFLGIEIEHRINEKNRLIQLEKLIDWSRLEWRLNKLDRSGLGPTGYPLIGLLKAVILGQWHSLSDAGLEDALRVRMDFILFCGLQHYDTPDETTLCRFRNALVQKKLLGKLLLEINNQLEMQGLKVSISQGAILDATVIQSAARPQSQADCEVVVNEEGSRSIKPTAIVASKDPESTWMKKGKKSYFGFKFFAVTDVQDGYIESLHVTSGHVSEMAELETAIAELSPSRLLADKGYASQANREYLASRHIQDEILYKAARNKPLTDEQKAFNKRVSKERFLVEQAFGTLKRRLSFTKAAYFGVAKTTAQAQLKAICFNLIKGLNLSKNRTRIQPLLA